ncbi:glycosyltransferase involved in cell wall biosynthesis [Arcanobacterium pluranimalium]|uniref:glycosyltransferase family 4 protein n=1 Tax=Arcanobacterium pluranimalium TaxID=108028 RepID=UPI001956547B|nr:glycosyltransferase family 4 protein [Arcanobacterium pluranimalium]MBM7824606.1 glycosyltransferase involved in cell wall biosynthesis [Arcanobacterium pluranimalium]
MKILIIAQQWRPETGVPQRRGQWMAEHLHEAGHDIQIITSAPHYPEGLLNSDLPEHQPGSVETVRGNVKVHRTGFIPHSQSIVSRAIDQGVIAFHAIRVARKVVHNFKPDLIFATAPPLPAVFSAAVISKLSGVPYVVDLRDAWPDLVPYIVDSDPYASVRTMRRRKAIQPAFTIAGRVFEKLLRGSAGIIVTSDGHASIIAQRYHKKTTVVTNLPLANLDPEPCEVTRDSNEVLEILYTGTVGRAQGLETAVVAAKKAKDMGANVHLTIVGTGAHVDFVHALANKIDAPVTIVGRILREEMNAYYAKSDTSLVILKAWEPFESTIPSKLFEGIAHNIHITGSLNGEGARLIQESKSGHVVNAEDSDALAQLWVELAQNRELLKKNEHGREWLVRRLEETNPQATFVEFMEGIVRGKEE